MFKTIIGVIGVAAVSLVLFSGVGAGVAGAQTASECNLDAGVEAYLECVANAGAAQDGDGTGGANAVTVKVTDANTLPRTGSDVGSLVGIGTALVLLGGAAVFGVRQRRQSTES